MLAKWRAAKQVIYDGRSTGTGARLYRFHSKAFHYKYNAAI